MQPDYMKPIEAGAPSKTNKKA